MIRNLINFLLKFKYLAVAAIVLLAIGAFVLALRLPSSDVQRASLDTGSLRAVTVQSVRELSLGSKSKNTIGTVQSINEADLRAERAGTITNVYARSGSTVRPGTIIASISGSAEAAGVAAARAEIESAEAGVAQATAALNKVKGGTRSEQLAILRSGTANAQNALNEALVSAKNALASAYAALDSGIIRGTDSMFVDADGANPHVVFESTNNSNKIAANNQRLAINNAINRQKTVSADVHNLGAGQVAQEITTAEAELQDVKIFLDDLLLALGGAIPTSSVTSSTIASYTVAADAARTSILGTLSSLSGARLSLSSAESALNIAKENESQGITGAQQEDVEAAEAALALAKAGLSRARAGVANAQAVYEKTLIRTPIAGLLTTLAIDTGDFVNIYQSVGTVANEGALEVVVYVSTEESSGISIGDAVLIDKKYAGTITNIASGLDSLLRQIEVRVAINTPDTGLIHGESVSVELLGGNSIDTSTGSVQVPIAAVKFEAQRTIVFSVSPTGTLEAHEVELGSIVGELVEVKSGILSSLEIVTDARGLREGQKVEVE